MPAVSVGGDYRSRSHPPPGRTIGFGTFELPPGIIAERAVCTALASGYRHIDTAHIYNNELSVGEAIAAAGIPREELRICTKLWNDHHTRDTAFRAVEESCRKLHVDYLDACLIHWPVPSTRKDAWEILIELKETGLCREIGVSNYTIAHIGELIGGACMPALNQVEFHPFLYQRELLEFCRSHGIAVEAYSPLAQGWKLNDPVLLRVAEHHTRMPAQVMIRWGIQHGVVPIVRSSQPEHIIANIDVFDFELNMDEMHLIDGCNAGLHVCWDPSGIP